MSNFDSVSYAYHIATCKYKVNRGSFTQVLKLRKVYNSKSSWRVKKSWSSITVQIINHFWANPSYSRWTISSKSPRDSLRNSRDQNHNLLFLEMQSTFVVAGMKSGSCKYFFPHKSIFKISAIVNINIHFFSLSSVFLLKLILLLSKHICVSVLIFHFFKSVLD